MEEDDIFESEELYMDDEESSFVDDKEDSDDRTATSDGGLPATSDDGGLPAASDGRGRTGISGPAQRGQGR